MADDKNDRSGSLEGSWLQAGVGQTEGRWIGIHGVSTVRWAERSAGARHANDKLLPSRDSQSTSTFTCQLDFPTVEMARRVKGKRQRLAIVYLDSGPRDLTRAP